jgi:hypothetical protein
MNKMPWAISDKVPAPMRTVFCNVNGDIFCKRIAQKNVFALIAYT